MLVPGKDTVTIGIEQALGAQIAAPGHQAFRMVAQRWLGEWAGWILAQLRYVIALHEGSGSKGVELFQLFTIRQQRPGFSVQVAGDAVTHGGMSNVVEGTGFPG